MTSVLRAMLEQPLDTLILQTHLHLVTGQAAAIAAELSGCCQLRVHISIESDRDQLPGLPPASPVEQRLAACGERADCVFTVVTVATLPPIAEPTRFLAVLWTWQMRS
ncbi:MAG: hypothetical protein U0992_11035 [Planctomycetaceae bacterium]